MLHDPFDSFRYDGDEPQGGAPASSPAPAPPAVASPEPVSTPPPAPEWTGVMDALKGHNLDLTSRFQDDGQALAHLASVYQRAQRVLPQYEEMLPHYSEFRRWQAEQAKAQQEQQTKSGWKWEAPDYDPSWAQQVTRDPVTGNLVPVPGAPPDIVQKYAQGQRAFTEKLVGLLKDPLGSIKPGILEMVQPLIQQAIQERLGGYQEQSLAERVLAQNAEWMWQRDASGNVQRDPFSGQQQLSPAGKFYQAKIAQAERMGIRNVAAQNEYAMELLNAALARQAPTPEQVNEQLKNQAVQGNQRPSAPPPSQVQTPQPMGDKNGLRKQMLLELAASGVKDTNAA